MFYQEQGQTFNRGVAAALPALRRLSAEHRELLALHLAPRAERGDGVASVLLAHSYAGTGHPMSTSSTYSGRSHCLQCARRSKKCSRTPSTDPSSPFSVHSGAQTRRHPGGYPPPLVQTRAAPLCELAKGAASSAAYLSAQHVAC